MTEQTSPRRQRMIDDIKLRNMSANTQKAYIRAVKNFSKHFGKSPDKLTFEDVRTYQLHLVSRGLQGRNHHSDHVRHSLFLQYDAWTGGCRRTHSARPQGGDIACRAHARSSRAVSEGRAQS
jgi:integrase/recombinase XerD